MLRSSAPWRALLAPAPLTGSLGSVLVLIGSLLGTAAVAPVFAAGTEVRVLLLESDVVALAALDRPLQLRTGAGGAAAPPIALLAAGAPASLRLRNGRLQLETASGSRTLPAVPAVWLEAAAPPRNDGGGDFQLAERRYRGRLQILVRGSGLQAINHVPLESYLPSVVGSEMPATWPQAALRAQAVAARTYALRQRKPAASFDLSATVRSQVYKGVEAETPSTREAVAATRGQVLTFGGQLANTVFHSSSGGGSTENSGDLWRQQLPYLVSVPDFDQHSPVHQWQKRLEPEQLQEAFPETGGVDRITVLSTTATGRIRQARVQGPRGSLQLSGAQLRSRLGLRSTLVRFELLSTEIASAAATAPGTGTLPAWRRASAQAPGRSVSPAFGAALASLPPPPPPLPVLEDQPPLQLPRPALLAIGSGFGHGVGMSQWGAYGLALRGSSHEQILRHYYRGTTLTLDDGR